MVATSTPETKRMRQEAERRDAKMANTTMTSRPVNRKLHVTEEAEIESVEAKNQFNDDELSSDDESEVEDNVVRVGEVLDEVNLGSYVLAECVDKKSTFYYIGKVDAPLEDGEYEIDFLKKSTKSSNTFIKQLNPDIAAVDQSQIKTVLPHPNARGTTARTKGGLTFPISFGQLSVR